jgi:CRISPR system Cascade subunit CasE
MYLSRIVLNGRSRQARIWLSDGHALHRMIMSGFPTVDTQAARATLGVLYRLEPMTDPPHVPVLVQSSVEPNWALKTDAITMVDSSGPLNRLLAGAVVGTRYRFRLRANPSRRVHRRAALEPDAESIRRRVEPATAVGKRVELSREEDQVAWLQRRAQVAGFSIVTARAAPDQNVHALQLSSSGKVNGRKQGRNLTLGTVLFEGVLEVTNDARFRDALLHGVGPGKAFGCGLLSVAPIQGSAS